jgi:preprotein translocase subunit SecD
MDRQWKIRTLGLLALVVVSVLMLVPTLTSTGAEEGEAPALPTWFTNIFSQKMVLGLDLQGGIHLQYKVDVDEALSRRTIQNLTTVEVGLSEDHQVKAKATQKGEGSLDELTTIVVTFEDAAKTDVIDGTFLTKHLPDYEVHDVEGAVVELTMTDQAIESFRDDAVEQAMDTIERRINAFGVAESTISRRGDNDLVVQLPGIKESDFKEAKDKLSQTGQLQFRIVDRAGAPAFFQKVAARKPAEASWPEGLDPALKEHKIATGGVLRSTSRDILEYMLEGQVGDEHMVGFEEIFVDPSDPNLQPITNLSEQQEKLILKANAYEPTASVVKGYEVQYLRLKDGMSGENVNDASVGYDQFNRPVVHMRFAQVDADRFYEMTKQFTGELMAIMIDEIVYSAPRIKEPIPGGRVQIELGSVGNQAFKEATALVAVLKSGALQAPLRKLYDSQVGPTLGADSIAAGKLSVIVGFFAVVIFMAVYYKGAGLVANLALILNLLFVMAGLTAFGATLTLPGIAGIVLTVGMAVDANVLIFERVREELRIGSSVRKAIDAGYEKAFSAIVDANVTTGIAAIVLYQFGSGPIRGFAVTLGIGIICSMYTALVVTRLVFDHLYGRGAEPANISI